MDILEEDYVSSEFALLLSNSFTISGLEQLFSIAFVFTVETGFIPTSLAENFDSINSNIQLAKMINNSPSLNSFWHQNNNIFTSQLVMSNQLCHLIGVPNGDSLIITLCYSNISKCILFENDPYFNKNSVNFSGMSLKYKNVVSVPVKCAILDIVIGLYPNLCGLPEELILHIMLKLETTNLYALMRCCKKLYLLAINNQFLWKNIVIKKCCPLTVAKFIEGNEPVNWRENYLELKKHAYLVKRTPIHRE
ncbi:F-box domain [Cinara cedri]|uniref:F-box domain n=1 Tax=Cinara cedri TaxID=506608 RepID=A0A5E4M2I0_9HEMI|nr:F-box domain [Cinara cedri]